MKSRIMIVMKFGGTSVKDAEAIKRTVNIVKNRQSSSFVILSALSGVTDNLIEICNYLENRKPQDAERILEHIRSRHVKLSDELGVASVCTSYINAICDELLRVIFALDVIGEISAKSKDMIFATGELLSSFIVAEYAKSQIDSLVFVDTRNLICTDSNFNCAEVDINNSKSKIFDFLTEYGKDYDVFVAGGFIAADHSGSTTTLGRGGSDYSAAIIAECINADRLEIWTDVDGILTSDPRLIENAMLLKEISYAEAAELSFFGAKVLHPKTIHPAVEANIPVYVLNSYKPDGKGTLISNNSPYSKMIKAIAFRRNITIINISSNRMLGAYGFLAKVFDVFLMNETSVDLVTTSEVSISLTIDDDSNLSNIINDLSTFATIDVWRNKAIISVVGEGIRETAGIAAKFFGALSGLNISMISMGASEVNLSIVLDESILESAVQLLHKEFFESSNLHDLFVKLNLERT
ncbi:MAG: lysine-sensitive aspartokinase 3 [Candidatus Kapaibacterium sp.]